MVSRTSEECGNCEEVEPDGDDNHGKSEAQELVYDISAISEISWLCIFVSLAI